MDDLSLGEYLKHGREKMELTIEDVSLATKISKRMIEAMENNAWHEFHSEIFLKHYLRRYTEFVGLDYNEAHLLYLEKVKNNLSQRHTLGYGIKWFMRPSVFEIRPVTAVLLAILLMMGACYIWLMK